MKTSKSNSYSYQQGDLDALCGIYGMINVVKLLHGLTQAEAKCLLVRALNYLNLKHKKTLTRIMQDGLTLKKQQALFDHFLHLYDITWYMPFGKDAKLSYESYWNLLHAFSSTQTGCILLRLTGSIDHWTVAHTVTEKSLSLLDSRGLKRIIRSACSLHNSSYDCRYYLWPSQTIFVLPKGIRLNMVLSGYVAGE